MIGKIVTGKSFKGAVEYVMKKAGAQLLACDGVDISDVRSVIRSFNFQRKARPEKAQIVGHISLSFHPDDTPRLTDDFMRQLAGEYMQRMGITDTQYIVVRHNDTEHLHIHILYNRVKYNAKLVRSHNERIRNVAACKAMKQKHGLTFSQGKQNDKTEKLHGPDKIKYAVYEAVKTVLEGCTSLPELAERLKEKSVTTTFVHRGGDTEKDVQGLTFTMNGRTLKASQVDRKFSYANLCKTIERNRFVAETAEKIRRQAEADERRVQEYLRREAERERLAKTVTTPAEKMQGREFMPEAEVVIRGQVADIPVPERITEIQGMKLTPEQQKWLYSPQGLQCSYGKNGYRNTSLFRVNRTPGRDILTEELLSQEKINSNPIMFGIRLTDEQVREIKDGQPVYIKGMQYEGETFDGYLVMDDNLTCGRPYVGQAPREWVEYGKYTMRRMDRDLIQAGFVVRAIVQWWGGYGQTARPYLWKENPSNETYKQDWNDPRKPKSKISHEEELHVPSIQPKKKSRGPKM